VSPVKTATALVLVLAAALAGCGGGSDGGATTVTLDEDVVGSPQLRFEPDPDAEFAYNADKATAKSGNVSFVIENPTPKPHTIAVEDKSGKVLGRTRTAIRGKEFVIINLKPGTYTYFCAVPGHREAGMEGTVTVEQR
jgi:plastocyanin